MYGLEAEFGVDEEDISCWFGSGHEVFDQFLEDSGSSTTTDLFDAAYSGVRRNCMELQRWERTGHLRYTERYAHIDKDMIMFDRLGIQPQSDDSEEDTEVYAEMDEDIFDIESECLNESSIEEVLWMQSVDNVLDSIGDKRRCGVLEPILAQIEANGGDRDAFENSGVIDEELRSNIKNLLLLIQRRNLKAGARPYTNSEITILVWECWYVDFLHSPAVRKRRGDGSSYSRSHLFGALRNAVTILGITDLPFLIAALHHDDYEDVKTLHGDSKETRQRHFLTAYNLYEDDIDLREINLGAFEGDPKKYVEARLIEIHNLVTSVSKLKDLDGIDDGKVSRKVLVDAYNLYLFFDAINKYGLKVALLKLSDRKHNTGTLKGLEKKSSQANARFAVQVTAKVYGQVALYVARCDDMYAAVMEDCFRFTRPQLVKAFEDHRDDVIKDRFRDPAIINSGRKVGRLARGLSVGFAFQQSLLKERLDGFLEEDRNGSQNIDFLAVAPARVGSKRYFDGMRIDDDEYDPVSEIDTMDPMYEVVVLIDDPDQIVSVQRKLVDALSPDEVADLYRDNGAMKVFVPELNGLVRFRVVDTKADLASQSGVVGHREKDGDRSLSDRLPRIEGAVLNRVVENVRSHVLANDGKGYDVVYREAEALKSPTVTVLTKSGEELELPVGSTVLDFAAAVHESVLRFMSGVVVRPDFGTTGRNVLPTKVLKQGEVVEVLTDGKPIVDLIHQYFVSDIEGTGRKQLRKVLRKDKDAEALICQGHSHLQELGVLFGASAEDILRCLAVSVGSGGFYKTKDYCEKYMESDRRFLELSGSWKRFFSPSWLITRIKRGGRFAVQNVAFRLEDNEKNLADAETQIELIENILAAKVGLMHLNTLEILADAVEMDEGIHISIQMPDEADEEAEFLSQFRTKKVNFGEKTTEEFWEGEQKMARLSFKMELSHDRSSSVYELLKWIVEVSQKPEYKICVTSDHIKKACAKAAA